MFRNDKRVLKPATRKGNTPHKHVSLTVNGVRRKKYIHIAGLEAFVCQRPNGMEGLHNDGNPENNHISNLRWGTHKENMQDSIVHGTFFFAGAKGENHVQSILKDCDVRQIRIYFKTTKMTNGEIGKIYGVDSTTISKIRTSKNWSHLK